MVGLKKKLSSLWRKGDKKKSQEDRQYVAVPEPEQYEPVSSYTAPVDIPGPSWGHGAQQVFPPRSSSIANLHQFHSSQSLSNFRPIHTTQSQSSLRPSRQAHPPNASRTHLISQTASYTDFGSHYLAHSSSTPALAQQWAEEVHEELEQMKRSKEETDRRMEAQQQVLERLTATLEQDRVDREKAHQRAHQEAIFRERAIREEALREAAAREQALLEAIRQEREAVAAAWNDGQRAARESMARRQNDYKELIQQQTETDWCAREEEVQKKLARQEALEFENLKLRAILEAGQKIGGASSTPAEALLALQGQTTLDEEEAAHSQREDTVYEAAPPSAKSSPQQSLEPLPRISPLKINKGAAGEATNERKVYKRPALTSQTFVQPITPEVEDTSKHIEDDSIIDREGMKFDVYPLKESGKQKLRKVVSVTSDLRTRYGGYSTAGSSQPPNSSVAIATSKDSKEPRSTGERVTEFLNARGLDGHRPTPEQMADYAKELGITSAEFEKFFGYRFAKARREAKREELGKGGGLSQGPDLTKAFRDGPESYIPSDCSGGDTQKQLDFERSNVAERISDALQVTNHDHQSGGNLDRADTSDQAGATDQNLQSVQVPRGFSWGIPSRFLRGKIVTTWTNPGIEYEWSNGTPGGLPDVEPVTHDLRIGRYRTRAYEPRSYIPKSAAYMGYTELQLRCLIRKRDHLGVAVSFPTRDGIYRDALVKFLEDQDAKLVNYPETRPNDIRFVGFYRPIMLSESEESGVHRVSLDSAYEILAGLDYELSSSDLSMPERDLFQSMLPSPFDISSSANKMVIGTKSAIFSLQDLLDYGAIPRTRDLEPFHGLRALATTLQTVRIRSHIKEGWDHEKLREITPDMMYALLFGNTDMTPTQVYRDYISRQHNMTREAEDAYLDMNSLQTNPTIHQMIAILDLLFDRQLLDRHYSLGVILQGERLDGWRTVPDTAAAVIFGEVSNAVVWILRGQFTNSVYRSIPHWEGFGWLPESDELTFAQLRTSIWGMRKIAIADDIQYHQEWRLNYDHSFDNPVQAIVDFVNDRKCDGCKGDESKPCLGRPCFECVQDAVPCRPLTRGSFMNDYALVGNRTSFAHARQSIRVEEGPDDRSVVKRSPWDDEFANMKWEYDVHSKKRLSTPRLSTEEPVVGYFLVITVGRVDRDLADMMGFDAEEHCQFLHDSAPELSRSHERLLQAGLYSEYAHLGPTAERPGGSSTERRDFHMSYITGNGMIGVRGEGGLNGSSAEEFAELIYELVHTSQENLPVEINFLIRDFTGMGGWQYDGWGIECGGLYDIIAEADRQHKTDILDKCFVTVCAEPSMVDGLTPHSYHYPFQTSGFVGFQGIMYGKFKLACLSRRWDLAKAHEKAYMSNPEGTPRTFPEFPNNDDYWADRVRNGVFVDVVRRANDGMF